MLNKSGLYIYIYSGNIGHFIIHTDQQIKKNYLSIILGLWYPVMLHTKEVLLRLKMGFAVTERLISQKGGT